MADVLRRLGERLFSLEAALLAFVGSGLYKTLPGFRAFPLDWTVVTGMLVAAGCAFEVMRLRLPLSIGRELSVVLVLLWLVYSATSILWSSGGETAVGRLTFGLPLVTLTFLSTALVVAADPERVRRLFDLLPLLGVIALFSTLRVVTLDSYRDAQEFDVVNYIVRGIAMSLGALVLVARAIALQGSRALRALQLATAALLGLGIVVAGSRQALLAFAVGLLVALAVALRRGLWRGVLATSAVATVLAAVGLVGLNRAGISLGTIDRLMLLVTTATGGKSFNERASFVETAIAGFLEAPWFGQGFSSFGSYHGLYPADYPHNLILETGFEGGLIGLLLLGAALLATAVASLRAAPRRESFVNVAVLLTVCVVGVNVLVSGTYAENRLMYLALGLALAAPAVRRGGVTR